MVITHTERNKKISEDLRIGKKVTDLQFDQVYTTPIRQLSKTHWTPVEVAIRAAELLVTDEKTRILDIGSGCGKFCTIGALSTQGQFTGIEQRSHLVEIARKTVEDLQVSHATFIHGNMTDLDWSLYDCFYLFNPFFENEMKTIRIDDSVSHNRAKYQRYIAVVQTKLQLVPPGTKVATYHGFGGEIPSSYRLLKKEPIGSSRLELWEKIEKS